MDLLRSQLHLARSFGVFTCQGWTLSQQLTSTMVRPICCCRCSCLTTHGRLGPKPKLVVSRKQPRMGYLQGQLEKLQMSEESIKTSIDGGAELPSVCVCVCCVLMSMVVQIRHWIRNVLHQA